jgi:hypothetical protein
MATNILTATVAPVKIGCIEIEGLLLETHEFAIAQQQIATLFSVIPTSAPKWLKTRLGEGFQLFQVKTNRNDGIRQNRAESALALHDFEKLLRKLDREGNKIAQGLVDDLVGLALHQLWADSFNIKFEQEERQLWLKHRQQHRKQFHPLLTAWLKQDAGGDSSLVQWGKEVNLFKVAAKLPIKPIDEYSSDEIQLLNTAEIRYDMARKLGIGHTQAIAVI